MKLKIIAPGIAGPGTMVYLDDKKLENVTDVTVNINVDKVNEAIITFRPTRTEIDGEFKVDEKNAK